MPIIRRRLAKSALDAWFIIFDRDELDLRIEHAGPDGRSTPLYWMSVEDFLVRVPKDETQTRARERAVDLIREMRCKEE